MLPMVPPSYCVQPDGLVRVVLDEPNQWTTA